MNSFIKKPDRFLLFLESRFGLLRASILIGLLFEIVAMMYVQPNFEVEFHGVNFSKLSEFPFDLHSGNPLQYRILAPLLGYLFFLRGRLFFILPLLFGVFLISAVYHHYRKKEYSGIEALVMSSLVAFSATLLIPLIAPAYTDTITFFFLFLSFASVNQRPRSALFFALALLNHESSLVLFPGLIWYSLVVNKGSSPEKIKSILAYLAACVPYLVYRWYVSSRTEVGYSLDFYFNSQNIGTATKYLFHFLPAAIFYAFKLFWFFPLYVLMKMILERKWDYPFLILLIGASVVLQLVIVFDYTRMIALAFPVILISAEKVRSWWGSEKFIHFSSLLILFNFFILQYYVTNDGLTSLFPWIYRFIASLCGHPYV